MERLKHIISIIVMCIALLAVWVSVIFVAVNLLHAGMPEQRPIVVVEETSLVTPEVIVAIISAVAAIITGYFAHRRWGKK